MESKNKAIKLTDTIQAYITQKLKLYWRPEQIVGRLQIDENTNMTTKTAYRLVIKDKAVWVLRKTN